MDISGILSQVRSGGFVNPISLGVQPTLNSLSIPSLAELTTMADAQALINGRYAPSPTQLGNALYSITSAVNKTQDLLGHTDRISGVNLQGGGNLATIARTMQSARTINGDASCSTALAAFGAIQNSAMLIADVVDTIKVIKAFLKDISDTDSLQSRLNAFTNRLTQQIALDVGALAMAQIAVVETAVAQNLVSLFQDECASQVLSAVMTQPMKNEVVKAVNTIKYKK